VRLTSFPSFKTIVPKGMVVVELQIEADYISLPKILRSLGGRPRARAGPIQYLHVVVL